MLENLRYFILRTKLHFLDFILRVRKENNKAIHITHLLLFNVIYRISFKLNINCLNDVMFVNFSELRSSESSKAVLDLGSVAMVHNNIFFCVERVKPLVWFIDQLLGLFVLSTDKFK